MTMNPALSTITLKAKATRNSQAPLKPLSNEGIADLRGELTEVKNFQSSLWQASLPRSASDLKQAMRCFYMDAYKRLSAKIVEILGSENLSAILDEQKEA